ncbi:MAG TPA: CaiB/BaiF CoA-transferase family protein [Blastocatellia bacterium]|nr:CaiB/BaiF CoA-transferase family protein [Blastocatellia bacterium]
MNQALHGVRVLDLSRLLPGPYCSMMLGDLGAEVIKVEDTEGGDPTRYSPPRYETQSVAFQQLNRNKKSIAINLKNGDGREIFLKLAATADVILEQFRPGVVQRLGIGYEQASAGNPGIIYCSLTGFGQDGPHRLRSGHDLNYLALAGVLGLTTDGQGAPVIPGVQVADLAGGMIAAFGILAALLARQQTSRGQYVDVSMFDVMLAMLTIPASQQFAGKDIPVGGKYVLSGAYPFYNVYQTADGKYMTLGALEPKFWAGFCQRIGREDLLPRQFDDGLRRENLFEEVRGIFKSRTQAEWIELMADADACCEPVLPMAEAFQHPQTQARQMVLQFTHPTEGEVKQLGFACKLSDTPAAVTSPSPALGEHTRQLLGELGIGGAEAERLFKAGAVKSNDRI